MRRRARQKFQLESKTCPVDFGKRPEQRLNQMPQLSNKLNKMECNEKDELSWKILWRRINARDI